MRRAFGPEAANSVPRRLVVPPHREGGQVQYVPRSVPAAHEGARLGPVIERMRAGLAGEQPLAALAREAGMSLLSFHRRVRAATGCSPGNWLLRERLEAAREMLEGAALPHGGVEVVAAAVGFGSAATLRHHFRRRFGVSPVANRGRFGG